MGIALWVGCGALAFVVARAIPAGRNHTWAGELAAALAVALLFGFLATALDFGGWKELDWRAALFAFLGAFAATGAVRAITMRS